MVRVPLDLKQVQTAPSAELGWLHANDPGNSPPSESWSPQEDRCVKAFDVERVDDVWCVRRGPGDTVPITQAGEPAQPIAGWRPTRLLSGIGPTNVLELRHDNGETSSWFLNADFSFRTNVLAGLPDEERTAFVAAAMQPVRMRVGATDRRRRAGSG